MQVFIIGSPLETAMALDSKRLNKQIIECGQILDALNGAKAWNNHPCVLQYSEHKDWLIAYSKCLYEYQKYKLQIDYPLYDHLGMARIWNLYAMDFQPSFHKDLYFDQMKRRLYTKDKVHYKQWANLGESDINWYWSHEKQEFIKYRNGKRIE